MKKTYINPTLEVVKITAPQLMAGSLNPNSGSGSVTEESVSEGTPGESRFFDFDDEEF